MARLYVGGPVPCRKQRANPDSSNGRPMLGTYQGLGMPSTVKDIQLQARKAGIRMGGGSGRKAKKLDPSNVCHRIKRNDLHLSLMRREYELARKCSLLLDQANPRSDIYNVIDRNWTSHILILIDRKQIGYLRKLAHMEKLRGQIRTLIAAKRAGITL